MYELIMTTYNDDGTIKEIEVSKGEDHKTLNAVLAMPEFFNDQLDDWALDSHLDNDSILEID